MDKKLLAVALTFLIAGILISSYSNTSAERVRWESLGSKLFSQELNNPEIWKQPWVAFCEKNVTAGDKIVVDVIPGINWYQFTHGIPEDPYNPNYYSINVTVIDPLGGRTLFKIIYVTPKPSSEYTQGILLPWRIELLSNDGRLVVNVDKDGTAPEIGGIAKVSGNYSVTVPNVYPSPPREIKIMKEIHFYTRPWSYLLPIGLSMTCGGAGLAVFSFKRKKTTKKRSSLLKRRKKIG
ncbi:hypothetical protein J7K27_09860 [Candidatus Bathyarchaeota archaeon]|nr:hypothetical protein [Candidatus Bathyarchaeota archaeon]